MATHNGGIVYDSVPHPSSQNAIALRGVWTGGEWAPGERFSVIQFREGKRIGLWHSTGVELGTHSVDPILLVRPADGTGTFKPGDIVTFDTQTFHTRIPVMSCNLRLERDSAIAFGKAHFPGIACVANGDVFEIVIFHGSAASLWRFREQPVVWRGKEYTASIVLADATTSLEFFLNGERVRLRALIDTMRPVRAFALDAGQQILFDRRAGRKRTMVYDYFEPNVAVTAGSVRVQVHPAAPRQLPLLVSVDEPLQLLAAAIERAGSGSVEGIVEVLSERVMFVDQLLSHLREFAHAALRSGSVEVRVAGWDRSIRVDQQFAETVGNALDSLEMREMTVRGVLCGIDTNLNWLRIQSADESGVREHWTIRFAASWKPRIEGKVVPREVVVTFATVAPPTAHSGSGELIDFDDAT